MKYFIILFILLGYAHLATCAKKTNTIKDSLLRIYITSPHDSARLAILHNIARLDQQSPVFLYYENKLLQEAKEQKNLYFESIATYDHVIYYYNKLDSKHLGQWMNRMEQLAQKYHYYNEYFKAKKLQIENYIINQQIELALHETNAMYQQAKILKSRSGMRDACLCLMTSYYITLRFEEGTKALNKAFTLMTPQDTPMDRVNMMTKAVLAYSFVHDHDKMFKSLNLLKEALTKLIEDTPTLREAYSSFFMFLETQYAIYYIRTEQANKAWEHLQQSEQYYTPTAFIPYLAARFNAYAEYYLLQKDYEQSINYLDSATEVAHQFSIGDVINFWGMKADVLLEMDKSAEALPLYEKAMTAKDSLYRDLSDAQMKQIQSLYNMDKLLLEKEQQQAYFHRICLAAIMMALLALIIFVSRIYLNRRKLKNDEKEMRRLNNIANEANDVKSYFLANMSYNIRIPLNNVVGFSQLLSTDAELDEAERLEYSTIIQANSAELIQLVNDVLDLSRLEAKMMKFQILECDIVEVCNDLVKMAQMHSDGHIQASLETSLKSLIIQTDVNRFNQAFTDLILYPVPCNKDRKVTVQMEQDETNRLLLFQITGSPLADSEFNSQKTVIRHKINQLLFEHFGGSYSISDNQIVAFSILY